MKKISIIIIALSFFIGIPKISAVADSMFEISHTDQAYPISRRVRYSFTLENSTNQLSKKAEFWAYVPVKQTATQRCIRLSVSHSCEILADDLGNQLLHFNFQDIPPYGKKVVTITADLTLSGRSNEIPVEDINLFINPERFIEADHEEIIQLAKDLAGENTMETVKNIYNWISNNIEYSGYLRDDRGALYALRKRRGDCSEFAFLFAALCRANKIPARCLAGYICSDNRILKPNDFHNWAEFYHNNTWIIVDPQKKRFAQDQSHYLPIKIISESINKKLDGGYRFWYAGDGIKLKMNH